MNRMGRVEETATSDPSMFTMASRKGAGNGGIPAASTGNADTHTDLDSHVSSRENGDARPTDAWNGTLPVRHGTGNVIIEEPVSPQHQIDSEKTNSEKHEHQNGGLSEKMNRLRQRAINRGHSGTTIENTDPSKPPKRNFGPGPKGFLKRVATVSLCIFILLGFVCSSYDLGPFGASSIEYAKHCFGCTGWSYLQTIVILILLVPQSVKSPHGSSPCWQSRKPRGSTFSSFLFPSHGRVILPTSMPLSLSSWLSLQVGAFKRYY